MKKNGSVHKKSKHSVFIVDDHPIVRRGLIHLINQEPDFITCGDAGNIPQAVKTIENCKPDIIIADISLSYANGIRLIEELTLNHPNLSILVFSIHDESTYAERCLKAGAKGYLMKQEPPQNVISALRKILDGDLHISANLGTRLLHKFITKRSYASASPVDLLSNRELEVFQLLGQGLKTKKIAKELNLSVKTVETYIDHIKKKMSFDDSRKLFLHAVQWTLNEAIH